MSLQLLYFLCSFFLSVNLVKSGVRDHFIDNRGQSKSQSQSQNHISPADFKPKGRRAEIKVTKANGKKVRKVKVNQYYKEIPVFGASAVFEYDETDTSETDPRIDFGIYFETKDFEKHIGNTKTKLKEKDLGFIIASRVGNIDFTFECDEWIYFMESTPFHSFLCKVHADLDILIDPGLRRDLYYYLYVIDAQTGDILEVLDSLRTGSRIKTASDKAGNAKMGISTWSVQIERSNGRRLLDLSGRFDIIDMHNTNDTFTDYQCVSWSNCDGTDEDTNGAYGIGVMAFTFALNTFDCFNEYLGEYPVDVALQPLPVRVHFEEEYPNAYWDGESVVIGDGDTTYYPFVSMDLMAHEMAHAYTEQYAYLVYSQESGAIDEAFSDLAGEACEFYYEGDNDWMVIPDIVKEEGKAARYMYDPPLNGVAIDDYEDYECGMNVHRASGVFNKAFYLMVQDGLDLTDVFQIAAIANQVYWTSQTTMAQAAIAMVHAADDLFPNENVSAIVETAFQAGNVLDDAGQEVATVECAGCIGFCGEENIEESCYCDSLCTDYNDCCRNRDDVCDVSEMYLKVPYGKDSRHTHKYLVLQYINDVVQSNSNYTIAVVAILIIFISLWLFCFLKPSRSRVYDGLKINR